MLTIKFHRSHPEAKIPTKAHDTDAAWDLYACESEIIDVGECVGIRSGLVIEPPIGYFTIIVPRSGLATNHKLIIPNSPCVIDPPYRGELITYMFNLGREVVHIKQGERYAQILLLPIFRSVWDEVHWEELTTTDRGSGGFGSTGR